MQSFFDLPMILGVALLTGILLPIVTVLLAVLVDAGMVLWYGIVRGRTAYTDFVVSHRRPH